jgi:hypothetical protein
MSPGTKHSILRWIHIVCAIPILGYVYSPFEEIPNYATPTRYVFFHVLVVAGLWMWLGHAARRLISKWLPAAPVIAGSKSSTTRAETD